MQGTISYIVHIKNSQYIYKICALRFWKGGRSFWFGHFVSSSHAEKEKILIYLYLYFLRKYKVFLILLDAKKRFYLYNSLGPGNSPGRGLACLCLYAYSFRSMSSPFLFTTGDPGYQIIRALKPLFTPCFYYLCCQTYVVVLCVSLMSLFFISAELLWMFFTVLLDEDIIEKKVFGQWKFSEDSASNEEKTLASNLSLTSSKVFINLITGSTTSTPSWSLCSPDVNVQCPY